VAVFVRVSVKLNGSRWDGELESSGCITEGDRDFAGVA
jgi:hypothetical protein